MRMTSKGQVTIPIEIREQLGLEPGDELIFTLDGSAIRVERGTGHRRGRRIVQHLRGRGDVPLRTDEITALTRGD